MRLGGGRVHAPLPAACPARGHRADKLALCRELLDVPPTPTDCNDRGHDDDKRQEPVRVQALRAHLSVLAYNLTGVMNSIGIKPLTRQSGPELRVHLCEPIPDITMPRTRYDARGAAETIISKKMLSLAVSAYDRVVEARREPLRSVITQPRPI